MPRNRIRLTLIGIGLVVAVLAQAQDIKPADPKACVGMAIDSLRLACYDRALGRDHAHGQAVSQVQEHAQEAALPATTASTAGAATAATASSARTAPATATSVARPDTRSLFVRELDTLKTRVMRADVAPDDRPPRPSLLDSRWELSPDSKLGTFGIRGYKPVYVLPAFYMSRINRTPQSPSPDHAVTTPLQLQRTEAKFQLSFKTKVWQNVLGSSGDLWMAYTQSSHWQVYNRRISRPFRETNYEPEAMLVFGTHYRLFGWDGRLLGFSLNHQSNGRSNPLSRSWNRIIANIGFERGPWTLTFRPWLRINESRAQDDNPDISDYMGRAEVLVVREWGANEFTLMGRHSMRAGSHSHGALRFSWAFPIHANLRGYVQVFDGYGESLIDYNHKATYVGLGISLLGWY